MQTSTRNDMLLTRSLASVWHPCTQMKQHETLPLVPVARAVRVGMSRSGTSMMVIPPRYSVVSV